MQVADRRSKLSAKKQALLEQRLKGLVSGRSTTNKIPRRQRESLVELSFAQQRLWFLAQLEPDTAVYNFLRTLKFSAPLDIEALRAALNTITDRHEALRTSFSTVDARPVQVISQELVVDLPIEDLSGIAESHQRDEVRSLATEEVRRPFDLTRCPLFRVRLVRLSDHDYRLLLVMHHILGDEWSLDLFRHELSSLYDSCRRGQESLLPALEIQYADYSAWERDRFESRAFEKQFAYWKSRLAGAPAMLDLPTDNPRPAQLSFRGSFQSRRLPEGLGAALRSLCQEEGATLFMAVLAAFNVLLFRYTGQDDILVGSPVAGRNQLETETLIGFFVNTLVLRTDLSGDPTFVELLRRTRETALVAFTNQDVPFEKLVQELQPVRDLGHSPLFQVLLNLHSVSSHKSAEEKTEAQWEVENLEVDRGASRADLSLVVEEENDSLSCSLEYSTDLFEAETIRRMLCQFETLLQAVVADPRCRISRLALLDAKERRKLLEQWSRGPETEVEASCVHRLFEEQAHARPEAVALVYESRQATYGEINSRANQLAHYLRRRGVGPEVVVGVCVERSIEMVIGVLGILKAGGAYLPLDPNYPGDRLAFMLDDAQVSVLLTEQPLLKMFSNRAEPVVCMDRDSDAIAAESSELAAARATASNLAYVIYTSGSTGKPKAVQIEHRALTNLLWAMKQEPGMTSEDILLAVTTLSFDIAALELFLPLILGGRLLIASREVAADGLLLKVALDDGGATMVQATPATWRMLIEAGWMGSKRLKILCGGEALPRRLSDELLARCGSLWNMYGPTETTIWSASCSVSAGDRVAIGKPIANNRLCILDAHLNPVPVGVTGELHIGGDGLARGYLHQPGLTAEQFIPNPFAKTPGQRLYKTGDVARYLANGKIECLGRVDNQIKLRGFRIELGEIESVLSRHKDVRECVVQMTGDEPENKRLVAYVVSEPQGMPTVSDLRGFLKGKLPEYMLPAIFVELSALPLTANGKINRRALPDAQNLRPEPESDFAPPRTPVEEMIAETWAEVLKVARVGILDNFFELGGHSLLAIQIISRIRLAFHVELPLRILFESPTVAALAEKVTALLEDANYQRGPDIEPVSRDQQLPLSFAQQRLWFLDQLEPGNLAYDVQRVLRLKGGLDIRALGRSINTIVSRHEILRTTFPSESGKPRQLIAPEVTVGLPVVDLGLISESEGEDQLRVLAAEQYEQPFDLSHGPLLRLLLLRTNVDQHVLLLKTHHIINDAWSMGILFRELVISYNAYSTGNEPSLPQLPVQYADYSWWQRQYLKGTALEKQLAYWRRQLLGAPEVIRLPRDRPRPPVPSTRGAYESLTISKEIHQALRTLGRRSGATLFMTILAAFQTLLWWYTAEDDIVVGSPNAGRGGAQTEDLIGCFVNTMVLRTGFHGDPEFREVLGRVHETTLGALANQEVPFEKLVEELRPERKLTHNPLFQVWFVLQHARPDPLQFYKLTVESRDIEDQSARHELQLSAWEADDCLKARFTYSTDLFERATVAHLAEQFQTLLSGVVSQPGIRLSELRRLLDAADKEYKSAVAQSLERRSRQKLTTVTRRSIAAAETVDDQLVNTRAQ